MDYARYIRLKAVADFYDSLSEDDKRAFSMLTNQKTTNTVTPSVVVRKPSFLYGVGENVVGNAVYGIGISLLKSLIQKI